jgi:hypothetical protein
MSVEADAGNIEAKSGTSVIHRIDERNDFDVCLLALANERAGIFGPPLLRTYQAVFPQSSFTQVTIRYNAGLPAHPN